MLVGSIAFTLSGATNSKFTAIFSVWLPDYYIVKFMCEKQNCIMSLCTKCFLPPWRLDAGEILGVFSLYDDENEM